MKKLLVILSLFMLAGCSKTGDTKVTPLNAPQVITVKDNILMFDAVEGDDVTYTVFIDDVTKDKVLYKEIKGNTETNITLPALETNRLYEVRVQAVNSTGVSVKTNAFTLHTFTELTTLHETYNTLESLPVTILGIDVTEVYYVTYGKVLSSKLSASSFQYEESVLSLKYSNLNTDSTLTFYVFTNQGYYPVEVSKITNDSPSVYNGNSQEFMNEDLYFQFDLAGGEFIELGDNITSDDYVMINNTLIIKKEFISALFAENETRSTIILSYQIKVDTNFTIGYIFIEKDTN